MQDSPYNMNNIPLYDLIFGKNLISLGGLQAVDNMFSDVNLQGKKLLDIGFGLGGVAYYLAEKYSIAISGIEVESWMPDYATRNTPRKIVDLLEFTQYDQSGKMPFPPTTFDLVYSKGVLNHVSNKSNLFHQINQVLKPNGLFVIADWIYPKAHQEEPGPLVCETQESYTAVLQEAGFSNIDFRDDSTIFVSYVQELLNRLSLNKKLIENQYGEETYSIILKDYQKLLTQIRNKQKFAVRIRANKST